jgi:hypothetical protein
MCLRYWITLLARGNLMFEPQVLRVVPNLKFHQSRAYSLLFPNFCIFQSLCRCKTAFMEQAMGIFTSTGTPVRLHLF